MLEINQKNHLMATETESIWPELELSDSEDDTEVTKENCKSATENLLPEDVTDDDLNGGFPQLKRQESTESSSEDEKDEPQKNKYLSVDPAVVKKKYDNKLREIHLKRVSFPLFVWGFLLE